jgi:hypothetical protein
MHWLLTSCQFLLDLKIAEFLTYEIGANISLGLKIVHKYLLDVLWFQPIKLIQVVSTSEFHEY